MARVKAIVLGTSPAETLRLEVALQQEGCLDSFRYIALEQAMGRIPDWQEWSLIIARFTESTQDALLPLLASPLRDQHPPVLFLIDAYDPVLVTRLLNAGAYRVLPVDSIESLLIANLPGPEMPLIPVKRLEDEHGSAEGGFFSSGDGFARLFQTSPVGISIIRLSDGRCLDCNESYARLLEWTREQLIGREALELHIPADIRKFLEMDEPSADQPQPPSAQFEATIFNRRRQIRHVHIHLDLIEWAGEKCVISMVQDITEREQAKEKIKRLNDELERLVLVRTGALEAANRELAAEIGRRKGLEDFSNRLSQILWETPDFVGIWSSEGRMEYLNKAGRKLFGLNEDESVTHLDLFSPYPQAMREWMREKAFPQAVREGIWRGETTIQVSDGREIPLSQVLLCKKDENNNVQYFAAIARDVSDFKNVEQELRRSRERYRTLAEAAHDFIFMISHDGLMEYANGFACSVLGVDPDKVEGIPASQFFPKNYISENLQLLDEVLEIDRPVYTEGPFQLEGQELWLGTWLVPVHNERGGLVSILGIARDITEQKATDEALQRSLQNERKLGEMRSNFFSMTSHQFRTPLSTILLSTELLQKYGERWDSQKRGEHLARIQEASRRLNSLLEDILVIGRAESGRSNGAPKEFDLITFCQQIIQEIITNDQDEHHIRFEHEMDTLPVYLDVEILHRVIDNLLSNAVKYSPKGSTVSTRVTTKDRFVTLEVTDQGIGIPEEDLPYLFQPFQRASNAGEYPGTGIGLTIIQKSLQSMNGSVSVNSKEGAGATFVVQFPVRIENAGQTPG